MRENIRKYYNILQKDRRAKRKWYIAISCMAALAVCVTSYALMKPAITMEKSDLCSMTEHTHTDGCYEKDKLVCELPEHVHGENCNVTKAVSKQDEGKQRSLKRENDKYSVEVKFTEDARIPDSAELKTKEIQAGTDEWKELYQKASDKMKLESPAMFCSFIDISFVDNGKEIEPSASVDVQVSYKKEDIKGLKKSESSVVHFADSGIEVIPASAEKTDSGNTEFTFTQDSFSIVGVVVTGGFDLTKGSYIFYDQRNDGKETFALGANSSGGIVSVPVTVDSNGYVSIDNTKYPSTCITWTYDGTSLYNVYANRYLQLNTNSNTATDVTTSRSKVSASGVNISNLTYFYRRVTDSSGHQYDYFLCFDEDQAKFYTSKAQGHEYRDYLVTAKVGTPEEIGIRDTDLSINDTIISDGCLKPVLKGNHTASNYIWYRSKDNKTWEKVDRRKVTGDKYNLAENGEWLNASLDGGARYYYKVETSYVDGVQLSKPMESNAYRVPYYDSLQNGSFEKPVIPASSRDDDYQPFMPNNTDGMVWKTTAKDSEIEFVSVAYQNFKDMSKKWHLVDRAADGKQYVELNAKMAGALYQDVLTIPDSTMYWKLAHIGRGTVYNSGEQDTMYLVIMSTETATKNGITTQEKVQQVINNPGAYPGAYVKKITSDNKAWHYYTGAYTVPENQHMSRYFFVAGPTAFDTNGGTGAAPYTVGNHLDDVSFSTDVPDPTPGKANLVVNKEIKGLSEADARAVLAKMIFTVGGQTVKGSDFSNFKKTGENTFKVSYVVREISLSNDNRRAVTEDIASAACEGYECRTTVSADGGAESESNTATVTLKEDKTSEVSFTNEYTVEGAQVKVEKTDDRNQPLSGAEFRLSKHDGTDWENVMDFTIGDKGSYDLDGLDFDTLYRLEETAPPNEYSQLTESIYFKIRKADQYFLLCDENGTPLSSEEADAKKSKYLYTPYETLKIINKKGYVLPKTGGTGTFPYIAIGSVLVLGSVFYTICVSGRRKREVK